MATRFVFSKNPNTAGRSGPGTRRGHTVYRARDRDHHDSQRLAPPYHGHRSTQALSMELQQAAGTP